MTEGSRDGAVSTADATTKEIARLRERLSRLSEASLRVNESLDFGTVLQGVLESARSLTGARYGVITLLDDGGMVEDYLSSGMTEEEALRLWDVPDGMRLFQHLSPTEKPLRFSDLQGHLRALGLPELRPPLPVKPRFAFLAVPVLYRGQGVGQLFVAEKEGEPEFTLEDEETLVIFASQAAMVIANARRYREERRVRADLETLIDTSPVGVVVFDAQIGLPVSVNREAVRIIDGLRTPEESIEQLLQVLTVRREDGQDIHLDQLRVPGALGAGETVRAEEIVLEVPDGRRVAMLVNATPIRSEQGQVESFIVTLQDMAPLEERMRQRAEFLAAVSYELRAPLTSIKGSAVALINSGASLDPAEALQFHHIIDHQADYLQSLISDLLDMAHIEAGSLAITPEHCDPATLVDQAVNTFVSNGRGDIRVNLPVDLPMVMADRRRVVQVLTILLSSAAGPHGDLTTVRVRAAQQDVQVAISVSGDGFRVPPERLPRLFRRRSRFDLDTGSVPPDRSGLGLALCRGIVEAHGGRIRAESAGPGPRTRFTFTLPAVEEVAPLPVLAPAGLGHGAGRQLRVLAVDDDPQALRYLKDALSQAGYAPITTDDPAVVAGLIREQKPHLMLLDLTLPHLDGIEFMRGVPELERVPVIFMSDYGSDQALEGELHAAGDDYMVKPFSPTELTTRIQAVLRRRTRLGWPAPSPSKPYILGALTVDFTQQQAFLDGRPLRLTGIEYRLLAELSANSGQVLTHAHLLQRVWGVRPTSNSGPLRTTIKNLRRKLGDRAHNPTYIFNQPRVGYRMAASETLSEEGAAPTGAGG